MILNVAAKNASPVGRGRTPSRNTLVGIAVAALISVISAGCWIILILQSL